MKTRLLLALALCELLEIPVRAEALTKEQRDAMTPDSVIAEMKDGNARFRSGVHNERNFLAEQKASAQGQFPAAVVLSCIDSRVPAEVIMDDHVELGHLTGLLDKVEPAIAATKFDGEHSSKNYPYVNAVVRTNVALAVADIRRRSPILRDLEATGKIKIVGAVYDLETAVVEFLP